MSHSGNYKFRVVIEKYYPQYHTAQKRWEKTKLAQMVIKEIQGEGGRFLKNHPSQATGCWVVATDDEACEKVKHRFRHIRKSNVKKSKDPTPSSAEAGTGGPKKRQRGAGKLDEELDQPGGCFDGCFAPQPFKV